MSVITNGVDLDLFRHGRAMRRSSSRPPAGTLVTYAGTHGMAHGLDLVLETAKGLANDAVSFLLVGEGRRRPA